MNMMTSIFYHMGGLDVQRKFFGVDLKILDLKIF